MRSIKLKSLTLNQIFKLTDGKKHWSEKKDFLIKAAKSFGIHVQDDGELQYLIEVHCPKEKKRIERESMKDQLSGKYRTNITPTDVKGDFRKVENPVIGLKYHISWAYSGAVFVLKKIENGIAYLDNPRNSRSKLLTCKVSELRHLRK